MNEPNGSKIILLGAGVLLAGAAAIYEGTQVEALRRQLSSSERTTVALQGRVDQFDSAIQGVRDQMADQQKDAATSFAKAQTAASQHADFVVKRAVKQQQQQTERLTEELGTLKETATAATTKLDGISTQVDSVKSDVDSTRTEVAQTKSDVEQTKAELHRTRGDMGEMSSLVATNSKEIQMLRDLGERNIYEFNIARDAGPRKVANITVSLKKTDTRRNRFTLDVLADDKHVEKKDRTINEPVQFYTLSARQPYELVVNQVTKDRIVGYLATPRVTTARSN